MKKLIIVLAFTVIPLLASSQLTGDGSFASPWSGTLAGDATWSGTKYIDGDIIVDNEKLTISPGAVIIFTSEGADLIITGTGQLEASGTAENLILFTADDDNDGNYGESGERWGHISFENMTTTDPDLYSSAIDYCIIEYGNKNSSPSGTIESQGGGLYIEFSYLTISNSIIRNNYAGWGGGLFITKSNPSIMNCIISNNEAGTTGGGILFYLNSSSIISNSLIFNNISSGPGGGGGIFLGGNIGNLNFVNCVIASNIATYNNYGNNIRFYDNPNSSGEYFLNSIIWGSTNSIRYTNTPISSLDFINCALQSPVSGSTTNCISLHPINNDPSGPNFKATDGSDWSIRYTSPCLDAGLDSYSGITIPVHDIDGNERIMTIDIGAYEVQYSRWNGSAGTDWSTGTNWDGGIPDNTRDIIIPAGLSNYPVSDLNPDFTIGSGKQMIIEAGARLTLNDLTNNGTLKMNANVSGLSSLIMNSYTRGSGASEDIQLFLTGGFIGDDEYNVGRWHYISSPVDNFPHDIFTSTSYNLAQWIDGIQGAQSIREGWVAYDGFIYLQSDPYDPGTWTGPTFNTMTIGKGYNFFYDAGNYTYSLSGQLNTTSVPVTLDFAGEDYENGFNLLGNPFTSGLDWDYIIENTEYPENTSHGIYFTKDDVQYSYIAGVLVPEIGEPAPSGVIPPMQGFFVKTYQDNVQINLSADARTHDNIPPRYKGKAEIPLLRLTMTDNESSDETVVRFAEKANTGIDYGYDALKMFIQPTRTALYTTNGTNKFSINGQPFLEPETEIQIPLTVNVSSDGNHTISVKDIQGLVDYNLYLIDNSTGLSIDLNESASLSFSSASGLITDRFIIKINNITTAVETPEMDDNQFNIYHGFGKINLQTLSDTWTGKSGSVRIMDMGGKTVSDHQNIEFNKDDLIQMQAPVSTGLYFVEVRSGIMRYVGKVLIK